MKAPDIAIGGLMTPRDMSSPLHAIPMSRRLELLIDSVIDYAIYMLDSKGVVTTWNPGAERIKGYAASEILGEHFSRFFTDEDRQAGVPARLLAVAAREGRSESEGWRVRKDGRQFRALAVIDAIKDEDGRAPRLRQDHARYHRALAGRAGVARQRAAVPSVGRGRHRLCHLHA